MMRKGQTALEYLMTYGWAILIVIVVVAALYSLGLTKPCRWVGTQITGFSGGGFQVTGPKATPTQLEFDLKRIGVETVNVTTIELTSGSITGTWNYNQNMVQGNSTTVTISFSGGSLTPDDCYVADITINYIDTSTGRTYTATGKISGVVETA